jgi:predicted transcriptional regulator YdeE
MEYTVVDFPEIKVIGLAAHTNNEAPDSAEVIGSLWCRLMNDGEAEKIPDVIAEPYACYGLYYNYDPNGSSYDVLVGSQSKAEAATAGFAECIIPAGRYAKFTVKGSVITAVVKAWEEIWSMDDLPRSFTVDFEAYYPGEDMENAEIDIFVALK